MPRQYAMDHPVLARDPVRESAFGSDGNLSPVDRFGVWLSSRSIHRAIPSFSDKRVGDFGCGYNASFTRSILSDIRSAMLVDVSIAGDLKEHRKITAIEGLLPEVLAEISSESLDMVLCISIVEHVVDAQRLLTECRRLLAPGGILLVSVPSWLGKRLLEFSAFRLGLSPAQEMDDHKMYYDPRDLWPLLRRAGFLPHNICCSRHKGGLNVLAVCQTDPAGS